ncbi:helix-turn-helix transcriptional regulator [Inquilinus sp. Marseille-Q2685]|uniref:AraC family transcriptional regulator n=1 Tax=Inquilinus sp. Marseille-Q2685 TaxID=2866581 RepID=UPI001CE46AE1|nr:helix-turn-helix transcriptional regulator [Inquilinus sp. Marseille-Q2685]
MAESWIQVERDPFPAGFSGHWHHHPLAQLIYPGRGVMVLHTRRGQWVVPPLQGCWLPAGEEHRVETSAGFEMLSAYCRGPLLRRLPDRCGVVAVSPLLREVILALEDGGAAGRARHRLCLVFADELRLEPAPRLFLQPLASPALRRIEAALAAEPAHAGTLAEWAVRLGTTTRSLARAFQREARMSFTAWRRQVRLRAALTRLAEGASVTAVAHDLGFGSASAFIRDFRRATGVTPKRCFRPAAPGSGPAMRETPGTEALPFGNDGGRQRPAGGRRP